MTTVDTSSATTSTTAAPPRTTLPARTPPSGQQARRQLGVLRTTDLLAVFGAMAASATLTGLLWTQIAPFTGLLGYIVTTWCLFVLLYAVLVSFDENRPTVRGRVAAVFVHSLAGLVVVVLAFIVIYTFIKGWQAVVHSKFYTQDMRSAGPRDPLTDGGARHAIIGTLIEVGIALAITVPLGLLTAVFLHEIPGRFSRFVRTVVDAMTALPDVIAGLFIYATLILILGLDQSGMAAATALAVTVLPIIIRASDVVLRLVPGSLTEASYALGSSQWRTVRRVTLPTARAGLATAVILGAARAIGETSPVLLTAGATDYTNFDPVHGPMMSLPLMAYTKIETGQPNEQARGFGAAAVLVVLVLVLFAIGRILAGRGAGQLTRRQQRRRTAASQRDRRRYDERHAAVALGNGTHPADTGG
jgi:phosphate transport system permease protein